MARNIRSLLRFTSRMSWRKWLSKNHTIKNEALLVIYKRAPKNARFSSRDALEEALCFGWIDGWFRPIDEERWVIRYTPRRRGSSWSKYNIARAWKLLNEGLMTPAGVERVPRSVLQVWKKYKPSPRIINTRGAQGGFSNRRDYLSMIKMPAKAPKR